MTVHRAEHGKKTSEPGPACMEVMLLVSDRVTRFFWWIYTIFQFISIYFNVFQHLSTILQGLELKTILQDIYKHTCTITYVHIHTATYRYAMIHTDTNICSMDIWIHMGSFGL